MMDNLSTVPKVIGIGGAGINIVSGILNNNFRKGAECIVMDTDLASLNTFIEAIGSAGYVILLAGLGGRTGSWVTPRIASFLRERGR